MSLESMDWEEPRCIFEKPKWMQKKTVYHEEAVERIPVQQVMKELDKLFAANMHLPAPNVQIPSDILGILNGRGSWKCGL